MQNVIAQTHGVTNMPDPKLGQGATKFSFSDRSAHTVVEIVSPKKIVVQADRWKRLDKNGMSESQYYEFSRDPDGPKSVLTLRKNGWWIEVGYSAKDGPRFGLGTRDRYHDFTF